MRYFVSCKNWLMVQFIGYNVEGGSTTIRGRRLYGRLTCHLFVRRKLFTPCRIYSDLAKIGVGRNNLFVLPTSEVASHVFTLVQIETDGGRVGEVLDFQARGGCTIIDHSLQPHPFFRSFFPTHFLTPRPLSPQNPSKTSELSSPLTETPPQAFSNWVSSFWLLDFPMAGLFLHTSYNAKFWNSI